MKRYITILSAAMVVWGTAVAQNDAQTILGTTVDIQSFDYQADSVKLNLEFNFEDLEIGVNESAVFAPTIYKGESSLELPTVVVKRRGSARSYNRAVALGNEKSIEIYDDFYGDPYQVVEYYGNEKQGSVQYSLTIPYQTWMVNSELYVDCSTYGCCQCEQSGTLIPDNNTLLIDIPKVAAYDVNPQVELIKPEKVAIKRRDIQYSSALIFRVNSTYIDPNLEGNKAELASIDQMMQSVISDSDYTITKVNIIGYASPEGTLATNMRLSEGRAKALETLMKREYKMIKSNLYSVRFGGENWDKLYEIVEKGDIEHREDVLNLIRNVSIDDGREAKLMSMNGGATYKYLLKNIFPATRLVLIDVEYNVDAYDIDRIGELIDTKPQNLSLEEMYRLSELYNIEDETFEKIFLTAVRIYPDDQVALNNALVTEIRRGNIESVEEIAERIDKETEEAEVANSLGAYYLLTEDYEYAQMMLQHAADLGSSNAVENLSQLDAKLENLQLLEENEALRVKIFGR